MRLAVYLLALILSFASCDKKQSLALEQEIQSESVIGTWELESSFGGNVANPPPIHLGQGNLLILTPDSIYQIGNGKYISGEAYQLSMEQCAYCDINPIGRVMNSNGVDLHGIPDYLGLKDNKLHYYTGQVAADGTVRTYQRVKSKDWVEKVISEK